MKKVFFCKKRNLKSKKVEKKTEDSLSLRLLGFWQSVQSSRQEQASRWSRQLRLRKNTRQRRMLLSTRRPSSLITLIAEHTRRQNRAWQLYGKNRFLFPFQIRGKDHIWTRKSNRIHGEEIMSTLEKGAQHFQASVQKICPTQLSAMERTE